MVRHERNSLLGLLPLGNIVNNNNQMSRHARGIAGYDAARRQNTGFAFRHFDFIVVRAPAECTSQRLGIRCIHPFGVLPLVDFEYGFPQNFVAADLEHHFKCPVHQHELARDGIFHDDGDRNVFND